MILGVIGGIGAGKSTVLEILEKQLRMRVLRTDDMAKDLYYPGSPVLNRFTELLGEGILNSDGTLDRKAMAKLLFSAPELTREVDRIVHPEVWKLVFSEMKRAREAQQDLVVETALPSEEFLKECDHVLFVYAEPEVRIQRLMESRGYSRADAEQRMQSQHGDAEYRELSDIEIDNSRSKEETIHAIYESFQRFQR